MHIHADPDGALFDSLHGQPGQPAGQGLPLLLWCSGGKDRFEALRQALEPLRADWFRPGLKQDVD